MVQEAVDGISEHETHFLMLELLTSPSCAGTMFKVFFFFLLNVQVCTVCFVVTVSLHLKLKFGTLTNAV